MILPPLLCLGCSSKNTRQSRRDRDDSKGNLQEDETEGREAEPGVPGLDEGRVGSVHDSNSRREQGSRTHGEVRGTVRALVVVHRSRSESERGQGGEQDQGLMEFESLGYGCRERVDKGQLGRSRRVT